MKPHKPAHAQRMHTPILPFAASNESGRQDTWPRSAEWGRKSILWGWALAMVGVIGYVYTMLHAPADATIVQAVLGGGLVSWTASAFVLVGLGLWLAGNVAILRAAVEPETDDETPSDL